MAESFNVYVIENKVNQKLYVGQTTKSVIDRWKAHVKDHKRCNYVFYKAMRKYGIDAFCIKCSFKLNSKEEMNELESFLIEEFNTMNPNGYNMTAGGEGRPGAIVTDETRLKISNSLKGKMAGIKNPMFGVRFSDERRMKISESRKGKIISDETREKMSAAQSGEKNHLYGVKGEANPLFGIKRSDEFRKKVSEGSKGKVFSEEHRRKISESKGKAVIDLETNEIHVSARMLSEKIGKPYSSIKLYLNGSVKNPDWFHFSYKTN